MGFFMSDRMEVKEFKAGFKEFTFACQSTETCQVCETECFYSGKTEQDIIQME